MTRPAPTSPVSWVFAPDCSATAVREPLVETAKPCTSPEAMFAAPIPTISWLGSTSSPRLAANADDVAIVSVSDTRVMPTAAMRSGPTSESWVHGSEGVGNPLGSEPTVAISSDRPNTADTTVAPTTATSTAGTFFVIRGNPRSTTSTPTPMARAATSVWSMCSKNSRISSPKESASVEKPKSFGSCPTMIVIARPFM